ncbi:hypothetical protein [Cyclobacterium marinum]|uniref:hypothetical protein n=1 Tax=Cyclobacterium marinum TaxID=104 RepID=UPI0011EDBD54|nr:hypothetical protein [Cyclobacterium marinum]MBI0397195.1 hypothetical protein [Cyclobacterium marinum]
MSINKVKMIYQALHVDLNRNKTPDLRNSRSILVKFFKAVFSFKIYSISTFKQQHFFFFNTSNQFEALKNVYHNLNNKSLAYYHGYDLDLLSNNCLKKYPFWISYFLSLYAYCVDYRLISKIYLKLKNKNENTAIKYIASITLGHYYLNKIILKFSQSQFVWLSNDHSYNNVSFIFAAKYHKIPSIYIQHASVSPIFPSLRFDYAFLDGEIAYQTYKNIGICGTKINLFGISKMDGWINRYSPNQKIKNILVCVNEVDDMVKFEGLIDKLLERKYNVYLRKHPYLEYKFKNENKLHVQKQKSFMEALNGIDLMIGGDSNVHLEAAITNVPSIYFSTSHLWDYYGFLKFGIFTMASKNENEIVSRIENYVQSNDIYLRAKCYCHSIDTNYQNQTTNKIIKEVNSFMSQKRIELLKDNFL